MGALLETCRAVSGSDAELVWMTDEFLLGEGVGTWMELPLWLEPAEASFLQADVSRAHRRRAALPAARGDGGGHARVGARGRRDRRRSRAGMAIGEAGMQPGARGGAARRCWRAR